MGLLAEIENDALTDATPVATMLRKMLVFASRVESDLLESWVRYELNGYPSSADLPEYRRLRMNFKFTASNGYNGVENAPLAAWRIATATKVPDIHLLKFRDPIGTIDVNSLKSGDELTVDMMNYSHMLKGKLVEPSYSIYAFWGILSPTEVIGVIEAVRNRVLEFVLEMQKKYPDAGDGNGSSSKPEVSQAVTNIYNNTILGNVGVVGEAKNSSVNITVNHGSVSDLRKVLGEHGVDEADIIELEAALVDEPVVKDRTTFGPKVASWVGKMAGKAATGAWNVGINVGTTVIQSALLAYYGLNG